MMRFHSVQLRDDNLKDVRVVALDRRNVPAYATDARFASPVQSAKYVDVLLGEYPAVQVEVLGVIFIDTQDGAFRDSLAGRVK